MAISRDQRSSTVRTRRLRFPGDRQSHTNTLRHLVTLQRRTLDANQRSVYLDVQPDVWAEIQELGETESLDHNQFIATSDFQFRIRFRTDVTTKHRIKFEWVGRETICGIVGITDPKGDRRYLLVRGRIADTSF